MSSIVEIRKYFGLSQHDLATYLSVSRSLLMKAELQQRSLPTSAIVKLATLQMIIQSKAHTTLTSPIAKNKKIANSQLKLLQNQCDINNIKAANLQKKFDALKQRYNQATNLLKTVMQLKLQPKKTVTKADDLWLQMQEIEARNTINKSGEEAQALLQWKISCYQFASEKANEIIQTLQKKTKRRIY